MHGSTPGPAPAVRQLRSPGCSAGERVRGGGGLPGVPPGSPAAPSAAPLSRELAGLGAGSVPACVRQGGSKCEMSQAPGRGAELSLLCSQGHRAKDAGCPRTGTFDRQHKSLKGALSCSKPHAGKRLASPK